MKLSNRWLIISGAVIGALVITVITLVFTLTRENIETLLPVDTPEGTVQRFFIALKAEDYIQACTYLTSTNRARMYSDMTDQYDYGYQEKPNWQATLGKSTVTANEATVEVTIDNFHIDSLLDNSIGSHTVVFHLRQEENQWKIYKPDYLWQILRYY